MNVSKLGQWGAVCALLLTGLFLAGCESDRSTQQFADVPGMTTPSAAPASAGATAGPVTVPGPTNGGSAEVIHVGDALVVIFSDLPIPTQPFEEQVKEDGTITLLLNKTFTAVGKTRGDL